MIFFDKVVCFWVIELKIVLVIEKWQVKPLPSSRLHRIDHVSDATTNENSIKRNNLHQRHFCARGKKHLLCVNFITLDHRMLLFVAAIANIEVEISDVIASF